MLGFLPSLGLAVVLLVGGRQVINGGLTLGDFTAFYTYLMMLIGPMRMLGMSLGMAQRAVASGNRLFEILDREPRVTSPPGAPPLPDGPGAGRVPRRRAALRRRRAGAQRTSTSRSRRAAPWRSSARPGSGKTSLVALIARLYDPSEGAVSVDGADLRSVDVASLRRSVAFVADDSFLFSATVAENIAYARPDATPRGDRDRGAARPGARLHHRGCRTATRRWSASAG